MVRMAVCDDDRRFLLEMKDLIHKTVDFKKINFEIAVFQSGEELLINIEETGIYDMIFLDIEMTHMDGIKTAELLREKYPLLMLIFVSNHPRYYRRAFDVHPYYFFDKPINPTEFGNICDEALTFVMRNAEKVSFLCNRIYYSLNTDEIIYLESEKRVIKVICHEKNYEFYDKLENLENYLMERQQRFLRIHKSYLINAGHIKEYRKDYIIMSNGAELMVSREKRKDIRQYFTKIIVNNSK